MLNRQMLEEHYEKILQRGLSREQWEYRQQHGTFSNDIVVQQTSGSSQRPPLKIPRHAKDILSIHQIVLGAWRRLFEKAPERVALIGGVSHTQAALRLRIADSEFDSFQIHERNRLMEYNPEFLSCYPSVARELAADGALKLPALKAIKLGGEPVFQSDVRRLMARFPGIKVIEQLGSTEMPAVAIGVYETAQSPRRLLPQTQRYAFFLENHGGWQPLVVQDNFEPLLFPLGDRYFTGDEVKWNGEAITKVRRADAATARVLPLIEAVLEGGAVNAQWDEEAKTLFYEGELKVGFEFARPGKLRRDGVSQKLPLTISSRPLARAKTG